jgi:ribonucleoside-diphosphate reductase subunit M2
MSKYAFLPIENEVLNSWYDKHINRIWVLSEISFRDDRKQYQSLDLKLKKIVKFILCFFSCVDGVVEECIDDNLKPWVKNRYKDATHFYSVQDFMETVHNQTYSKMIEVLIEDEDEKKEIYSSGDKLPCMKKLILWYQSFKEKSMLEKIIVQICVEGNLFNSMFLCIRWIEKTHPINGLCKGNEFISKDEALHALFHVSLYMQIVLDRFEDALPRERILEIFHESLDIGFSLIDDMIEEDVEVLNRKDMKDYMRCTADTFLSLLDLEKRYNVMNPYPWMVTIGIDNKSSFFEKQEINYNRNIVEDSDLLSCPDYVPLE